MASALRFQAHLNLLDVTGAHRRIIQEMGEQVISTRKVRA